MRTDIHQNYNVTYSSDKFSFEIKIDWKKKIGKNPVLSLISIYKELGLVFPIDVNSIPEEHKEVFLNATQCSKEGLMETFEGIRITYYDDGEIEEQKLFAESYRKSGLSHYFSFDKAVFKKLIQIHLRYVSEYKPIVKPPEDFWKEF